MFTNNSRRPGSQQKKSKAGWGRIGQVHHLGKTRKDFEYNKG